MEVLATMVSSFASEMRVRVHARLLDHCTSHYITRKCNLNTITYSVDCPAAAMVNGSDNSCDKHGGSDGESGGIGRIV